MASQHNRGFLLLARMGWRRGEGLGARSQGESHSKANPNTKHRQDRAVSWSEITRTLGQERAEQPRSGEDSGQKGGDIQPVAMFIQFGAMFIQFGAVPLRFRYSIFSDR